MKKLIFALFSISLICHAFSQDTKIIACQGKVIPGERISRLATTSPMGNPPIVSEVCISKGEFVEQGKILAVLRGKDKGKAVFDSAKNALEIAKSTRNLKIQEAKNLIDELEGTYSQNLFILNEKSPPRSERERLDYEQKSIARKIEHAKSILPLIIKNEDNLVAQAESKLQEVKNEYDDFTIKSPISGDVIALHVKVGELVGNDGFCEIADTNQMFVEAEVYLSDITKVNVGDQAECSSEALKDKILKGKVVEISPYVKTNKIFSQDPSEYSDLKVVLVKIKLDDGEIVKKLIGSQVRVKIFTTLK